MPHSQALVDTYFRFGSFYRPNLVQFPIPAGNESLPADLPRCVFVLLPRSSSLDGHSFQCYGQYRLPRMVEPLERPEIRLSIDC